MESTPSSKRFFISTNSQAWGAFLTLGLITLVLLGLSLIWGSTGVLWSWSGADFQIILWELRLPRTLLALIVGAGLGVSGAVIQSLFRTPLAGPEVLGVSSGASAGAVIALILGANTAWGLGLGALTGALAAMSFIFMLWSWGGFNNTMVLILAGLCLSSLLGALVSLLLTLGHQNQLSQYFFWILGSLDNRRWDQVVFAVLTIVPCTLLLCFGAGKLNLFALGDETASSLGISIHSFRLIKLFLCALTAASCVAVSGAIAFVGLMIPQAIRIIFGEDERFHIPLSALAGGAFLVAADIPARLIISPYELPVGIVTALTGGPFFLFLLVRHIKRGV